MLFQKHFVSLLFCLMSSLALGQNSWTWTELPSMPEAVSNHAVVSAYSNDTLCVYSFCGIDSSKTSEGIHLKSWKYNTISQAWSSLPAVPDVQGKIAASASTVNNMIYLIGGYYVNEDQSELSSDDVHILNPNTDTWENDGSNIPVAIDDQFQGIWRDSLIYVVTGWSDTQNVRDVQIYDPANDQWSAANDLPFTSTFPVFGSSGTIVNDTIYYLGGVNNGFSTMSRLRKGIIDENDPISVEWSVVEECPFGNAYRFAVGQYYDQIFFVGGSADGYNFDGISYADGSGVEAQNRIITYYSNWGIWEEDEVPYGVMDLRSMAQISPTSWILCGGMMEDQEVSNRVFLLEFDPSVSISEHNATLPNVSFESESNKFILESDIKIDLLEVYSVDGRLLDSIAINENQKTVISEKIPSGIFLISLEYDSIPLGFHRFFNY